MIFYRHHIPANTDLRNTIYPTNENLVGIEFTMLISIERKTIEAIKKLFSRPHLGKKSCRYI